MTFERSPGTGAEHATPIAGAAAAHEPTPVQIRLQILSTEHWSLLASRSLAWNESFSRAAMFLSTLSGALVALGLIGGVDGFHDPFFVVALVVLPVVLFVGLGTWLRMNATNYHDAVTVAGMNRIRGAYLEIAPDLGPYFVMGVHDDRLGITATMAIPPGTSPFVHILAGTPTLVVVLNGVVSGAIVALVLLRFTSVAYAAVVATAIGIAIVVVALQMRAARRNIGRLQGTFRPLFPTPPASGGADGPTADPRPEA